MGQPRPRWCWTLRHQEEQEPDSERVSGTADQAAPNHWREWALLVRESSKARISELQPVDLRGSCYLVDEQPLEILAHTVQ